MTGQRLRTIADATATCCRVEEKHRCPSRERVARFTLQSILRDSLNIPLQSSTMKHAGMRMAFMTILLLALALQNNRAVTACSESTNRRHHIRSNGHNFLLILRRDQN
jgi:hypothetical protein